MWPLDLLQPRRLPVSPLPSPALPSPGSWITRSRCSGATSGHSLGLKDSTAATESRDSPSLHQRGKISPMRRMEGRDQGLALESRWKNQRIWDFPSSVFSGRFKGNFWRGFSKKSFPTSGPKATYGKEVRGWNVHLDTKPRPERGMFDPKGTRECSS